MSKSLVVQFTKMHGAGNDFVVIDNRFFRFSEEELALLAETWCPRKTGIGADGLLALGVPDDDTHDYRMHYYNADGSRASMCGNGARCLARFARRGGIEASPLVFETDAGVYRAAVPGDEHVRLMVDPPRDFRPRVSLHQAPENSAREVHYIWTGTEHAVTFVDDVERVPVPQEGAAIRGDDAFAPPGANANFVQVASGREGEAELQVRTFEKGVEAETDACGTGALAAAAVARLLGRVSDDWVDVQMPGGQLRVGMQMDDDAITELILEGPAVTVFRGTVEVNPTRLTE